MARHPALVLGTAGGCAIFAGLALLLPPADLPVLLFGGGVYAVVLAFVVGLARSP